MPRTAENPLRISASRLCASAVKHFERYFLFTALNFKVVRIRAEADDDFLFQTHHLPAGQPTISSSIKRA